MLCCCNRNDTFRTTLDRADSTLNQQPEKTLAVLDSIKPEADGVSKELRMRYLLLLAQSRNKSYQPLPSEDTLQAVIDYYRKHGTDNDRMQSLYMMGSLYRDKGDAPMALKYYNDAAAAADTTDSKCDLVTLSRVYGQMAELFHYQRTPTMELEMQKKAERTAIKAKDTLAAIAFYENSFSAYGLMGKDDSVVNVLTKASALYIKYGYYENAFQNIPPLIHIYLNRSEYDKVKKLIDLYETKSGFFDDKGNIKPGFEGYYARKGRYYYGIGKLDSAKHFFYKVLNYPQKIDNTMDGYNGLMSVYKQMHLLDSVAKYAELYCKMNDSISIKKASENILRMHTTYYQNKSQTLALQNGHIKSSFKMTMVCLCCIIFIIITTCIYYIRRFKKRQKEKLIKENTKFNFLLAQYEKQQKEEELRLTIENLTGTSEISTTIDSLADFEKSKIVEVFHRKKDFRQGVATPNKYEWRALEMQFSKNLPTIYKILINDKKLSPLELRTCILLILGFEDYSIANITDSAPQTITTAKSRANKKIFNAKGAKTLKAGLFQLIKEL